MDISALRTVFMVVLALTAILKILIDVLNLKHQKANLGNIPDEFKRELDREKMEKMLLYNSEKTKAAIAHFIVNFCIVFYLVFSGILNTVIERAGYFRAPVAEALLFFLIIGAVFWAASVPFGITTTFRTEKKFGFTRHGFSLWVKDEIKSLLISVIIGAAMVSAIMIIIEKLGSSWWLVSWVFFLVFGFFVSALYPALIAPLFNKFILVEREELAEKIKSVLDKSSIKCNGVFRMDAGKRTSHTNAFFTGIGKTKRIVLYDTLLAAMDDDEIVSIVAHEAGHWKKKHMLKLLAINGLYTLIWFSAAGFLAGNMKFYEIFALEAGFVPAGIFLAAVIWIPINYLVSPLLLYYSRGREKEADDFAVGAVTEPDSLRKALLKLAKINLSNLNPHPLYVVFNHSHPPVLERMRRIEEHARGEKRKNLTLH